MLIQMENISKSFGENKVLKNISVRAESGKALGILGRNGAGKTTSIRILMGVFPADEGTVLLDGKPIDRSQIKIGYLPEERGLYAKKKIMEQLVYFSALKGVSKKKSFELADYWLDRLGMTSYKNRRLDTLSKGNQQKIQLVVTLISNPDVVILDEPFSGLDPVNAILLKDVVKELIQAGKIVLFSSHQMNYIEEFCDEICILNQGNIVLDGSIREIKRSYDRSKILIRSNELPALQNFLTSYTLSNTGEEDSIAKGEYIKSFTNKNDSLMLELGSSQAKGWFFHQIAKTSIDVDEIKVFEPSLNDIFVEYTEAGI